MSHKIFRNFQKTSGVSKQSFMADKQGLSKHKTVEGVDFLELQALLENGKREIVKDYVKEHYLGSAHQVWLMRTKDEDLIVTYLLNHQNSGLFEEAEELLMSLNSPKLRQVYLEQWHLRQRSLLQLFAEKQYRLLQRYVVKHPDETFTRTMISLMFEAKDEKLILQYIEAHPEILDEPRYIEKLKNLGLEKFFLSLC